MSLKDVPLKAHYISGVDDLVHKFYIPMLEQSNLYQRRTGVLQQPSIGDGRTNLSGLMKPREDAIDRSVGWKKRDIYEDPSKHVLGKKADRSVRC